MDNPATESSALDTTQAASLFANILEPQAEQENQEPKEPAKAEPAEPEKVEAKVKAEKPETVEEATPEADKVTIEVDGKTVELTKAELADYYKNGLRQSDYTKKTMEVAEQRKAAEAEATKAREERQQYAQKLQEAGALLAAQLQEQSQIDWQKLLETDPVEYLKQQHLVNARQARLNQIANEQQQLHARHQAEQAEQMKAFIRTQREELLAKLPDWKDESKAKAESAQIKEYLAKEGFDENALNSISDHRAVILARKAMLYDQMMSKASAAAKKVQALPQKVERPGGGESSALDGRTAAMKQLQKSGKVEDAARVFANLL
jgi:hypothetical protein